MTPTKRSAEAPGPRLTVDDLKHKALNVRDLAEAEFRRLTEEEMARNAAIVVGVVLLTIGFAFYLGTRRAPKCPPPYPLV